MGNKRIFSAALVMLFLYGCASVQKTEINEAENLKAKELLERVRLINGSSPDTIESSFTADGNTGEKKFRIEGKMAFDKKGYYKISVIDYVFQSPVVEAYRELDRLYFYYPAEKRLIADNVNMIDVSVYTGINAEFKSLNTLFSGGIPLIEKYKVYKCLYDEKEKGYNLILENDDFFENIFFTGDIPEKILFIHKQSRNKAEIYLKSPVQDEKSMFFRNYRIVLPEKNSSINIKFSKPVLNKTVFVEKLNLNKLPKKTEIIKVN